MRSRKCKIGMGVLAIAIYMAAIVWAVKADMRDWHIEGDYHVSQ